MYHVGKLITSVVLALSLLAATGCKPDLIVDGTSSGKWYVWALKPDQRTQELDVVIKNQGPRAARSFLVNFYPRGCPHSPVIVTRQVDRLSARASVSLHIDFTPHGNAGNDYLLNVVSVDVKVDYNNRVRESNERNNKATVIPCPVPNPDLVTTFNDAMDTYVRGIKIDDQDAHTLGISPGYYHVTEARVMPSGAPQPIMALCIEKRYCGAHYTSGDPASCIHAQSDEPWVFGVVFEDSSPTIQDRTFRAKDHFGHIFAFKTKIHWAPYTVEVLECVLGGPKGCTNPILTTENALGELNTQGITAAEEASWGWDEPGS